MVMASSVTCSPAADPIATHSPQNTSTRVLLLSLPGSDRGPPPFALSASSVALQIWKSAPNARNPGHGAHTLAAEARWRHYQGAPLVDQHCGSDPEEWSRRSDSDAPDGFLRRHGRKPAGGSQRAEGSSGVALLGAGTSRPVVAAPGAEPNGVPAWSPSSS